jgi:hypothetical protein
MRGAFCPHCGRAVRPNARFCPGCGSLLIFGTAVLPAGATLQAGRYVIMRLLGRGGNGAVYQVEDGRLRRTCVAKELQGHFSSLAERRQAQQDFERETLILARLSTEHPGLPQVYDFFAEGDRHYLVMQYVAGLDLDKRLRTGGPLAEGEAITHGAAVADVLMFLHAQQPAPVIHRDIKPANLIVDPQGRVKLVDFGLAKALPSTTSALQAAPGGHTSAAGTAGYTPLEQWMLQAEARSDVYALGATLHHLLTGRDPTAAFKGHGELNLELIRRLAVFPPLRELRPDLSPTLDTLLTAMLAADAGARPTATEVQATLAGMLKPGRSRVVARPVRKPAAPRNESVLSIPLLSRDRLAAAVGAWVREQVTGVPAPEPVTVLDPQVEWVPLALADYHIAAQFEGPSGQPIHTINAHGASVLDGTAGRPVDPALAAFVAAQRPAFVPVPLPLTEGSLLPFRQDARQLREGMVTLLTAQYTERVTYQSTNGRTYGRVCRPARKQVTFEGGEPALLHLPRWTLQVGLRGQRYALEAFQAAPDSPTPLLVGATQMAGLVFCPTCGRLYPLVQMVACAVCGRQICGHCAVQRSRMGIFRKQFCSATCAEAFAARGSVLSWL